MKKRNWLYLSLGCLGISILSLFLSIISYTNSSGITKSYNIFNMISDPNSFTMHVSREYSGNMFQDIYAEAENFLIIIFAVIGVAAIVCAIAGVLLMAKQRPTNGSFILAVIGLVGTALPAISILIMLLMSKNYFSGTIRAGLYVIITPLAMIFSIITVTMKHNRSKAQIEAWKRAEGYLRRGSDL